MVITRLPPIGVLVMYAPLTKPILPVKPMFSPIFSLATNSSTSNSSISIFNVSIILES